MAMTPKEQLDIIAAHIAGEEIQKTGCWDSTWDKAVICGESHQFNFAEFNYRIKPKPLELWVNLPSGVAAGTAFLCQETAIACRSSKVSRTVHMREVLGD